MMRRARLPDRWLALLWLTGGFLVAGALGLFALKADWSATWIVTALLSPWLFVFAALWRMQTRSASTQRALIGLIASYRDGDHSVGLTVPDNDLAELVEAHNALGDTLREQRIALVQRELLLDTVVQNTPLALILVDSSRRIVLANLAARRLLGEGHRLEGRHLDGVIEQAHPALADVLNRGGDALFSVGKDEDEDVLHLSRREFRLNGRPHELLLLRQLTAELRRQEVQTWKKVIRIISHELNNSLAPIASLAHSGAELLRRGLHERLPQALETIEDRARHLEGFIRDYARFAKLPSPRLEVVRWCEFLDSLASQIEFNWKREHEDDIARFDRAQMEQALLNLLKNAQESGGDVSEVGVQLRRLPEGWRLEVLDRGNGMSKTVIAQALLPFYSTKRNGTGLGLALTREIAEAHGGAIGLTNREGGGLSVSITIPN